MKVEVLDKVEVTVIAEVKVSKEKVTVEVMLKVKFEIKV